MQHNTERWMPVTGYEGIYEVSDHGRVRSLNRVDCRGQRRHSRIIKPRIESRSGYPTVQLFSDGKPRSLRVHRLVAKAFLPNPDALPQVCHGDGNPTNNTLSNLRWGSASENMHDTVKHGRHAMVNKTHCKQGHEFTPENTGHHRNEQHRYCITCSRHRAAEHYRRRNKERHDAA